MPISIVVTNASSEVKKMQANDSERDIDNDSDSSIERQTRINGDLCIAIVMTVDLPNTPRTAAPANTRHRNAVHLTVTRLIMKKMTAMTVPNDDRMTGSLRPTRSLHAPQNSSSSSAGKLMISL